MSALTYLFIAQTVAIVVLSTVVVWLVSLVQKHERLISLQVLLNDTFIEFFQEMENK
jgi:uncharacterized membrane protein